MDTNEKLSNEESSFNEQKINNIILTDMSSVSSNASSVSNSSEQKTEDLKEKEETEKNEDVKESITEEKEKEKSDDTKSTALVVVNSGGLVVARNMFKKSIKFSIKSFLISVSLTILNFFI